MQQIINDYFTFTKKERRGIFVLLGVISILLIFPYGMNYYFTNKHQKIDTALQQQIAALQIDRDASNNYQQQRKYNNFNESSFRDYSPNFKVYDKQVKGELFYFDPNTLTVEGWQKLGVSEKTATTIQNYISKGGQFRQPEDIGKIYGLNDYMVERLMPFVQITSSSKDNRSNSNNQQQNERSTYVQDNRNSTYPKNTEAATENTYADFLATYKIDINTADITAWKKLPGIGSKISARIITYKNKLGGFHQVNQVAETFGLADSTFQKIKTNLVCNPNNLYKININTASAELLKHPYIDKSVANNILQYRNQHGAYKSMQDLKKLALINETNFQKMLPYITIE